MAGVYFQFPLSLLAYGATKEERIDAIVSHNITEFAMRTGKAISRKSLKAAQEALNVSCADPLAHERRWQKASTFVHHREQLYGRDPLVRIGAELVWDTLKGTFPFRDFSLLSALNSCLGASKKPRRVTEPSLRVRAAGYKSWKVFTADVPEEEQEGRLMTANQVRYSLARLHERKLFARARVGARTVKYLTGVTDEELRQILVRTETYSACFQKDRAKADTELRDTIKAINVGTPINDGNGTNWSQNSPDTARHGTDTVPDTIPDTVPDINNSLLNRSSLNESSFNESKSNDSKLNEGSVSFFEKTATGESKEERGYIIEGQFLTAEKANDLLADNPSQLETIISKAQPAVRRGGVVELRK